MVLSHGEKAPSKEPLVLIPRAPAIGKPWKAGLSVVLISLTVLAILTLALPGSPQVSSLEKAPEPEAQAASAPEASNQTPLPSPTPEATPTPEASLTPEVSMPPASQEGEKILVRMTERGFYPSIFLISLGETVVWENEETVRPRLTLVSEDGLFPDISLDYLKIKEYKFNNTGTYSFTLGEYPDLKLEITVI